MKEINEHENTICAKISPKKEIDDSRLTAKQLDQVNGGDQEMPGMLFSGSIPGFVSYKIDNNNNDHGPNQGKPSN